MRKFKAYVKKLFIRFKGLFPTPLPTGRTQFEKFCDEILTAYGFDAGNTNFTDSYKNALASMILQLGPTTCNKPYLYFARSIKKSQSNQISYAIMTELREKKKQEEEAKQQQEATKEEEQKTAE